MSDFLSIANELAGKQTSKSFSDISSDFGMPKPAKKAAVVDNGGAFDDSKAPTFSFDNGPEFRQKLAGKPALQVEFDRQFPQFAPQQKPPEGWTTGGQPTPSNPQGFKQIQAEEEPWYKKVAGAFEAGATLATGATTGYLGGVFGAADALVRKGLYSASGAPEPKELQGNQFMEAGFNRGAKALTYQPRTESGQNYAEAAGDFAKNVLAPVAPLAETSMLVNAAGPVARTVTDKVKAGMDRKINGPYAEPMPPTQEAPGGVPRPTLSQASPQTQEAVRTAQAKGVPVNQDVLARHVEAETLPVPMKLSEGQATLDPAKISREMNGRAGKGAVDSSFYNQQGKQLVENARVIRERAAPDITATNPVETGQILVDRYKAMDAPIRAEISAKYKALADANGGDLPVIGEKFVAAADAALKKANRTRFLPGEVKGILDDMREGGPMTFNDFETYRTILAEQARKAERAGDGTASYAIGVVREALESLPIEGEAANLKPLADAARAAAKARFDRIKTDPAYKAAINDGANLGEPSPIADKFVSSYVVRAPVANVKQMKTNLANDPVANQAIAAGTLDHLMKMANIDEQTGSFSQAGWNKALSKDIAPKIVDLLDPQTAQYVQTLGNVAKYTQAQPRGHFVNNSNTFTAQAGEAAKTAAEGAANVAAKGVPIGTWARKVAGGISDRNAAKKALAPGAGITSVSDFPGVKPKPVD